MKDTAEVLRMILDDVRKDAPQIGVFLRFSEDFVKDIFQITFENGTVQIPKSVVRDFYNGTTVIAPLRKRQILTSLSITHSGHKRQNNSKKE